MRAECTGAGICPKFSCRYNLTLEVTGTGGIKLLASNRKRGRQEVWPMEGDARYPLWTEWSEEQFIERIVSWLDRAEANCVLDIVERYGSLSLREIGKKIGLEKQGIAITEIKALRKLLRHPEGPRLLELMRARIVEVDRRLHTDASEA